MVELEERTDKDNFRLQDQRIIHKYPRVWVRTKSAMGAINFCRDGCHTSVNRVSATLYAHLTIASSLIVVGWRGIYPLRIALTNREYAFRSLVDSIAAYGGRQSKHASKGRGSLRQNRNYRPSVFVKNKPFITFEVFGRLPVIATPL